LNRLFCWWQRSIKMLPLVQSILGETIQN
jgi:hypothetical protein